jgi:DNA modification methylase
VSTTLILLGDVRDRLRQIPSESVHCVVTSPPYFGLRAYLPDGHPDKHLEVGAEATPDAYVAELVAVFRECRRVLRGDGTLWLNLGDSYAAGPSDRVDPTKWPKQSSSRGTVDNEIRVFSKSFGLANKQRLMIPARVALAMQADGWWLRDEIIWHKPNPMPVSVTDRTTPAHEMLYMFAKSSRYYYDMEAIKEPSKSDVQQRRRANGVSVEDQGRIASERKQDAVGNRTYTGFNERYASATANCGVSPLRQPRSVWTVTPKPFSGAHFATFPPDLIRPCILAGCPPLGLVLDPFFGAGTTGLVAASLGRSCLGIELNPEYGAIAAERLGLRPLADGILGGEHITSPPLAPV